MSLCDALTRRLKTQRNKGSRTERISDFTDHSFDTERSVDLSKDSRLESEWGNIKSAIDCLNKAEERFYKVNEEFLVEKKQLKQKADQLEELLAGMDAE